VISQCYITEVRISQYRNQITIDISTAINANNSGSSSVDKMQTFDTAFDDKGTNGPSCQDELLMPLQTLHSFTR